MSDNAESITIKISNPSNLPTIDYRVVKPFQGELKDLSEANYNKLKNVLIKRGFKVPLFIWHKKYPTEQTFAGEEYFLMDGHQRQRVMVRENMQPYEVPYILIEAETEAEAKAQLLEISSQYGTITQEGFDKFVADLPEADLKDLYFDRLTEFSREPDKDTVEDEVPEVSNEPAISKLGEIYQLGNHKLMCADATDFGSVTDLMDSKQADLIFTDPPYGVSYDTDTRPSGKPIHSLGAVTNDDLNDEDFIKMLSASIEAMVCVCKPEGAYYICFGGKKFHLLQPILDKQGIHTSSRIVWVKNQFILGRSDYHTQWEFIIYGYNADQKHNFYGGRDQSDVWQEKQETHGTYLHPTMKPIKLIARALQNSSKESDIILDLFSGSGSTLIACEQLNRVSYNMEIDPKYCDVIRKRYWQFINNSLEGWQEATPVINAEALASAV